MTDNLDQLMKDFPDGKDKQTECAWFQPSRAVMYQDDSFYKQCRKCDGHDITCEEYVSNFEVQLNKQSGGKKHGKS